MMITQYKCPECGCDYFIAEDVTQGDYWGRLFFPVALGKSYNACIFSSYLDNFETSEHWVYLDFDPPVLINNLHFPLVYYKKQWHLFGEPVSKETPGSYHVHIYAYKLGYGKLDVFLKPPSLILGADVVRCPDCKIKI